VLHHELTNQVAPATHLVGARDVATDHHLASSATLLPLQAVPYRKGPLSAPCTTRSRVPLADVRRWLCAQLRYDAQLLQVPAFHEQILHVTHTSCCR
jgi:hypothetical protein